MNEPNQDEMIGPNGLPFGIMLKEDLQKLRRGIIPDFEHMSKGVGLDTEFVLVSWSEFFHLLALAKMKRQLRQET